ARSDDQVGAGGLDSLVSGCGFGGSYRVQAQSETTFATTIGHAVSELGIATQLEHAEEDVHRGLTGDGLANFDVRLQAGFDFTVQRCSRLADVLAGTAGQQGEGGESGGVGYVFHAKLLCTMISMEAPLRGNALPRKR